jgi:hypothetical protein
VRVHRRQAAQELGLAVGQPRAQGPQAHGRLRSCCRRRRPAQRRQALLLLLLLVLMLLLLCCVCQVGHSAGCIQVHSLLPACGAPGGRRLIAIISIRMAATAIPRAFCFGLLRLLVGQLAPPEQSKHV